MTALRSNPSNDAAPSGAVFDAVATAAEMVAEIRPSRSGGRT